MTRIEHYISYLLLPTIMFITSLKTFGQGPNTDFLLKPQFPNADEQFESLQQISDSLLNIRLNTPWVLPGAIDAPGKKYNPTFAEQEANLITTYVTKGQNFWRQFPNDERKYFWFQTASNQLAKSFHYWENIKDGAEAYANRPYEYSEYSAKFDWTKYIEWKKIYPTYKKAYLEHLTKPSSKLNDDYSLNLDKIDFLALELQEFFELSRNKEFRAPKKGFDFQFLLTILSEFGKTHKPKDGQVLALQSLGIRRIMGYEYLSCHLEYGINETDLMANLKEIRKIPNIGAETWSEMALNIFKLKDSGTFVFHDTATSGEIIEFMDLRGKVVLFDFWNLSCSSCIKRMPYLLKLYSKYKGDGFEIISVCAEPKTIEKLNKIAEIEHRLGAKWPTVVTGTTADSTSLTSKFWKQYGFPAIGQLFLFDKEGKMTMYNNTLLQGDFEPILCNLLKK